MECIVIAIGSGSGIRRRHGTDGYTTLAEKSIVFSVDYSLRTHDFLIVLQQWESKGLMKKSLVNT